MLNAVFLDFYGTVVHEDGEVVAHIIDKIASTGNCADKQKIAAYWSATFSALCSAAHGLAFRSQRELEYESVCRTLAEFRSSLDASKCCELLFEHWVHPPLFDDARDFFESCRLPIYIISNIDTADLCSALSWTNIRPTAVFTSEMARSYKPRPEIFNLALNSLRLNARDVKHFGDSVKGDVMGAASAGIRGVCVTRGRRISMECDQIYGLRDALSLL